MGKRRTRLSRERKIMKNTMMMILLVVCILFAALFIGGYRLNKKIDSALATKAISVRSPGKSSVWWMKGISSSKRMTGKNDAKLSY